MAKLALSLPGRLPTIQARVGIIPPEKSCAIDAVGFQGGLIASYTRIVLLEKVARTFAAVGEIRAIDAGAFVTSLVQAVLSAVAIRARLRAGKYYEG